jgi:hypothetical protein
LRDAKIIQSLLIAAVIFAAVTHRLYHSNSLLLFGLSPCIWGTISQRGPCKSSALAFDSLRFYSYMPHKSSIYAPNVHNGLETAQYARTIGA